MERPRLVLRKISCIDFYLMIKLYTAAAWQADQASIVRALFVFFRCLVACFYLSVVNLASLSIISFILHLFIHLSILHLYQSSSRSRCSSYPPSIIFRLLLVPPFGFYIPFLDLVALSIVVRN